MMITVDGAKLTSEWTSGGTAYKLVGRAHNHGARISISKKSGLLIPMESDVKAYAFMSPDRNTLTIRSVDIEATVRLVLNRQLTFDESPPAADA